MSAPISDRPLVEMTLAEMILELDGIDDLDDRCYGVRTRAVEDEEWGPWDHNQDSWDHPAVVRYGALVGAVLARARLAVAADRTHDRAPP